MEDNEEQVDDAATDTVEMEEAETEETKLAETKELVVDNYVAVVYGRCWFTARQVYWRRQHFSSYILDSIQGQIAVGLKDEGLVDRGDILMEVWSPHPIKMQIDISAGEKRCIMLLLLNNSSCSFIQEQSHLNKYWT